MAASDKRIVNASKLRNWFRYAALSSYQIASMGKQEFAHATELIQSINQFLVCPVTTLPPYGLPDPFQFGDDKGVVLKVLKYKVYVRQRRWK